MLVMISREIGLVDICETKPVIKCFTFGEKLAFECKIGQL